ncbi:MAG: hypothetical protein Alpg2KO_14880 [Alphaproteobacteria bacterium]
MGEDPIMKAIKPLVLIVLLGFIGWVGWHGYQRYVVIPPQVHAATIESHYAMQATVEAAFNGTESKYATHGADMLAWMQAQRQVVASIRTGAEPEIPQWRPFDYWTGSIIGVTSIGDGDRYRITYARVPTDACTAMLTQIKGRQGGPFRGVANDATATEPVYQAPLDPTVATALCRPNTKTDLAFFYR